MRLVKLMSASALSLLLGVAVMVCSQNRLYAQEQHDEAKPQQQPEPRPEAARPEQQDEKARPNETKAPAPTEDKAKAEDKAKTDDRARQEDEKSSKDMNNKDMNKRDSKDVQTADKGRAGGHGRIPDDKFRSNFGRQHTFAVHTTVVSGRPQFQYGGYSFTMVDAWPGGWAYTDDCYIDYIDGEYFLFDLVHPGVRLAIVVI